jgi:hypothetical protein
MLLRSVRKTNSGVKRRGGACRAQDRGAVQAQLERILDTPQFRISRRYPNLLRHVVEQVLEGRADGLKERTLGIEVFGRDPAYDTNADPVVRMTAGQVRRRLAEYYQESGREREIRIELPVGSYVPVFRKPAAPEPQAVPSGDPESPPLEDLPRPVPVKRLRSLAYPIVAVLLLGLWRPTSCSSPPRARARWRSSGAQCGLPRTPCWCVWGEGCLRRRRKATLRSPRAYRRSSVSTESPGRMP